MSNATPTHAQTDTLRMYRLKQCTILGYINLTVFARTLNIIRSFDSTNLDIQLHPPPSVSNSTC